MRNYIEISRKNLLNNYDVFCSISAPAVLSPVVKANAYGHGLEQIYRILAERQPSWLCVNYVEEASQLRGFGYGGRILVVGPVAASQLTASAEQDLDLIVGNRPLLEHWKTTAAKPNIHIKFDTGMSRQGFVLEEAKALRTELQLYRQKIAGVATHFANVEDVLNFDYPLLQLTRFQAAAAIFKDAFPNIIRHAASSASTLLLEDSRLDLCRVGISLYGQWPSSLTRVSYLQQNQKLVDLRPVLRWLTEVDSIKQVAKGMYIGYGCTYRAAQAMKIAILPVGYYEGYPRIAGENHSYVLLRGSRCQIVGRICMNMMMVDVSHLDAVKPSEPVVLLGDDGDERISGDDLGEKSRTIDYEILSRLNPEIQRKIIAS